MLAWKVPSVQVAPGLLWQTAHSIWLTPVTDTPPIVAADVKRAEWSIGCRSDVAFSTIPAGRMSRWQSRQPTAGCWNPELVNTEWNWPAAVIAPGPLTVWQSTHFEVSSCCASPASRMVDRHWPPTALQSASAEHALVPSLAQVHWPRWW